MAFLIPPRTAQHSLDAVVIGRAGMDLYPDPHGTKTADADRFTSDLGGSAGNIAVAMARHGLDVGLAAPVSDDPVGQFVRNKLRHYGYRGAVQWARLLQSECVRLRSSGRGSLGSLC